MGKFPVISITLKGATGRIFDEAKGMLRQIVGREALRFQFLMQSDKLSEMEHQQYRALINVNEMGIFTMVDEILKDSLLMLSQLLKKHYGQEVVMLIDDSLGTGAAHTEWNTSGTLSRILTSTAVSAWEQGIIFVQ